MKRRYRVVGNVGVVDPEEGPVASGGVVKFEESVARWYVEAGLLELETDQKDSPPVEMSCPLCVERGVKKPPTFAEQAGLAAHYTEHHPGFVVPSWKGGE